MIFLGKMMQDGAKSLSSDKDRTTRLFKISFKEDKDCAAVWLLVELQQESSRKDAKR